MIQSQKNLLVQQVILHRQTQLLVVRLKQIKAKQKLGVFVGTVGTSEELGINYENMQKNIKDGTEIIGNWGIDYGSGIKTTLVLKR